MALRVGLYCIVTKSKFARGYGCASEFRLRLEGLRQVRHAQDGCTAPPALYPDTGEVGEGEKWEGVGGYVLPPVYPGALSADSPPCIVLDSYLASAADVHLCTAPVRTLGG